jgi:[protein-PII] uridylyltransferase
MVLERGLLLADESRRGSAWCTAHSDLVDAWLASLLDAATGGDPAGVALVAVGGYGRSELCPHSDIDVMLVHDRRPDIAGIADRVWYPIWDEALHLGHSVCTVREALTLAAADLDTATALLSARHVAGDHTLATQLASSGREQWQRRSRRWLAQLSERVRERHGAAGEVAFRLEPDLKDGRGGLRDVHALHWAEAAQPVLVERDAASIESAYSVLLDSRVELHRVTGRPTNVLALQEQADVARALGDVDPDELMARVATSARSIAWTSDDAWRRVDAMLKRPLPRGARRSRRLEPGISIVNGDIIVEPDAAIGTDPTYALRVAAHAARLRTGVERGSLERLAAESPPMTDPWPATARDDFVDLLLQGRAAVPVIEALDQRGIWTRILPEWAPVQSLPQRNAYHRFTVDRHLLEATANAAALKERTDRPDLLVVAALLHDLGKGYPGDHSEAGVALVQTIAPRLGFPPGDTDTLAALVEHHLLLAEVATRRDLDDPVTAERVARTVGSADRLFLLAALTEADSLATGAAAWGPWKAALVAQLVDRVVHVLEGRPQPPSRTAAFPSPQHLAAMGESGDRIEAEGDVLTVMTDDRPGVFSRVAGVLALHGLDVLAAAAYSSDEGRALAEFRVTDPYRTETPWERIKSDLLLALGGRLAVHARVADRARNYGRTNTGSPAVTAAVNFHTDASADATIVDVHTADGVGVLYRITRAMAELDLDIRSARVQTLGHQVVDAFYVRDRHGDKITDRHHLAEIERAILHALRD